jgi:hypothetical protein
MHYSNQISCIGSDITKIYRISELKWNLFIFVSEYIPQLPTYWFVWKVEVKMMVSSVTIEQHMVGGR